MIPTRDRVDIEKYTPPGATEGFIDTTSHENWSVVEADAPATVIQDRSREGTRNDRIEATTVFRVQLRRRGLRPEYYRFRWKNLDGKILNITGEPRFLDPLKRYEEYVCTSTDADG